LTDLFLWYTCNDGGTVDKTAGAAGGGDITGVQFTGRCKDTAGSCDFGGKGGRAVDGAAGAAGGNNIGDIKGARCIPLYSHQQYKVNKKIPGARMRGSIEHIYIIYEFNRKRLLIMITLG